MDYITNRFLLESNYEQAQLGKGGMERDVLGGGGGGGRRIRVFFVL